MNDGISASCKNANSTTLKIVVTEILSEMKRFPYLEKKERFYDETISEGISTCYEMFMVCRWA